MKTGLKITLVVVGVAAVGAAAWLLVGKKKVPKFERVEADFNAGTGKVIYNGKELTFSVGKDANVVGEWSVGLYDHGTGTQSEVVLKKNGAIYEMPLLRK